MRKGFLFILIIAVVWGGLAMLAAKENGVAIPTTGKGLALALAPQPNPEALDAQAQQRRAEAAQFQAQAEQARQYAAQATQYAIEESARQAQSTADAYARQTAEAQRQTQAAESTATAEIVQVTLEAARAQATQQAQITATAQANLQAAAQVTATADAIKLAALSVQATKVAREAENEMARSALELQAASKFTWFTANWPFWVLMILCAFAVGGGYAVFRYVTRYAVTQVGTDGAGHHNAVALGGKLLNPDLMISPAVDPAASALQPTPDAALEVARLNQARSSIWGLGRKGYSKEAYQGAQDLARAASGSQLPQTGAQLEDDGSLPVDVPWSVMQNWPGKKWTFGQGANGHMISMDPDDDSAPHILGAGTTGSGKSHYLLHALIPQALASNRLVVALGRSGVGLDMFAHPNFKTVLLDDPAQAIDYLEAAYQEVIRRQRAMAQVPGIYKWSMWRDAPDPAMLLVMDEFSDLADEMETDKDREDLWRFARMVAAEGRKAGVLLAIALQDPTHRSIDLRIRRNCTPVAFQVQDEAASRVILRVSGAEKLAKRHFMTRLAGQVVEGVAFDVTPGDVQGFLSNHPAPALSVPNWLCLPATASAAPLKPVAPQPVSESTIRIAELIREVWLAGGSKSAMARQAGFTQYGGSMASQIDAAVEYLTKMNGSTTSTGSTGSTLSPENGQLWQIK